MFSCTYQLEGHKLNVESLNLNFTNDQPKIAKFIIFLTFIDRKLNYRALGLWFYDITLYIISRFEIKMLSAVS